jgi:hypothetical protein
VNGFARQIFDRRLLLGVCLVAATIPLRAADTGSEIVNLMRGMFTGLSLLGQAANTPGLNNYTNPGGLNWAPGMSPWGGMGPGTPPMGVSPWGASPWAAAPWANNPWQPAWGGAQPGFPGTSPADGRYAYLMRMLQGSWETNNGGLLLIKGNLARLYVSRDRYQDLEITVDRVHLWMRPAGSTQTADRYEHRIFDRRIVLRDRAGKVLLLRRHVPDEPRD